MSAFMTDEDLEALKIDSDDQASHAAQHKREQVYVSQYSVWYFCSQIQQKLCVPLFVLQLA